MAGSGAIPIAEPTVASLLFASYLLDPPNIKRSKGEECVNIGLWDPPVTKRKIQVLTQFDIEAYGIGVRSGHDPRRLRQWMD
jgi:hypothetical protein